MEIILEFQGEEVYRLTLPKGTHKAVFDVSSPSSFPYSDVEIRIPALKELWIHEPTEGHKGNTTD